ncbi:MAG: hypothetical protein U0401_34575 [Anaerolineae bacterium]
MLKKAGWLIIIVAIIIGPTVAGCWAGLWLAQTWNSGGFVRWERLPPLPQPPLQLVGGAIAGNFRGVVYVKTIDGQVYACRPRETDACWLKTNTPSKGGSEDETCAAYPLRYTVAEPPGPVKEHLRVQWCHFEAGAQNDFVLLEDGSIWVWQHWDANYLNLSRGFLALGCGPSLGLLIGVAGVIFLWRWKGVRRKTL